MDDLAKKRLLLDLGAQLNIPTHLDRKKPTEEEQYVIQAAQDIAKDIQDVVDSWDLEGSGFTPAEKIAVIRAALRSVMRSQSIIDQRPTKRLRKHRIIRAINPEGSLSVEDKADILLQFAKTLGITTNAQIFELHLLYKHYLDSFQDEERAFRAFCMMKGVQSTSLNKSAFKFIEEYLFGRGWITQEDRVT